jgi:hypothetical protein
MEVLGSHFGRDTGFPDIFRGFSQFLQSNSDVVPRLGHDPFFVQIIRLSSGAVQSPYLPVVKQPTKKLDLRAEGSPIT